MRPQQQQQQQQQQRQQQVLHWRCGCGCRRCALLIPHLLLLWRLLMAASRPQAMTSGAQASVGPALQALLLLALLLHLRELQHLAQRWLLLVVLQLQAEKAAWSCYAPQ
jgi:hypothetical protein